MLKGVHGDAPLVGEDGLAGGVEEDSLFSKRLAYADGARRHLECHIIDEDR